MKLQSDHALLDAGRPDRIAALLLASAVFSALSGCTASREYPARPITLVCPWGAGGGTDRVSRHMALFLEHELGTPVNVVNATGGKGVTGHARGLKARPDGYTITMATLELNMMHFSGLTDLTYEDCLPLMSINEPYAALFVRNDAPWQTLAELKDAILQQPGQLQASGTAAGGAWHLAIVGWLLADDMQAEDVTWVSSTGAGPSLQEMISGGLDMVCCSLSEAATLYEAGEVRCLGVMADSRIASYPDVETFAEQGVQWSMGGWRGIAVPQGTPGPIADKIAAALLRIVTGQAKVTVREKQQDGNTVSIERSFPDFMQAEGFDHTWREQDEFEKFLAENDAKFGRLLTSKAMKSVGADPFNPMAFPGLLIGLLVIVTLATGVQRRLASSGRPPETSADSPRKLRPTAEGWVNFIAVMAGGVAYVLLVEQVGFVITTAAITFALAVLLRVKWWIAAGLAMLFVPLVYQVFAGLLRVPLPQGWLGW